MKSDDGIDVDDGHCRKKQLRDILHPFYQTAVGDFQGGDLDEQKQPNTAKCSHVPGPVLTFIGEH